MMPVHSLSSVRARARFRTRYIFQALNFCFRTDFQFIIPLFYAHYSACYSYIVVYTRAAF